MKQSVKDLLASSLEEVLCSKSLNKITVGDISEHCGVSRTTFYRHFKDKYECMNWVYQRQIFEIVMENTELSSRKRLNSQICQFLYDKRTYFSNVANYKEQNSLMECIFECGTGYAISGIKKKIRSENVPDSLIYAVDIYIYGSVKAIERWLKEGCKGGPDFLAAILNDSLPHNLLNYFNE